MTDATAATVTAALAERADPELAAGTARYFQSGPGQYGEGDVFIGIRVPALRQVVKRFPGLPLPEIAVLLASPVHEHRLAGLLILVGQFQAANRTRTRDEAARIRLSEFYLAALRRGQVNNWDLVDSSAPTLLGAYLFDRPRDILFELAASDSLWQRRAAMIATLGSSNTATPRRPCSSRLSCSKTGRASCTRRSAGRCARSANAWTATCCSVSSTSTPAGCRAPRSATPPNTSTRSCAPATGARRGP